MATSFTNFSYERFMRNMGQNLEPSVRYHLSKVYACLTATCAAATVGSIIHLQGIWQAGLLSALISLGLVLGLVFTPDNGKNFNLRLGLLLGFGAFSGHSLGLLLEQVIFINPAIVVTALVGTTTIFTCLSAAAVLAKRGSYLFLGGILMSTLSAMFLISLGNLLFRSYFVHELNLYLGLAVMSGFVLFDTQMIMEKHRMGSNDCIAHSLDLFYDVISIFRRLLIILTQKEQNNERKKKKN
ncbi:bax inhibitor 1 [Aedes albopictus]|uniref:Putative bax-mediated apoptosis inhibitor tegt/bi-1 n=1 Tax=Aedes albopictus TaxID=7160 RepID=A0A023EN34_AEDAL|nr:bax inhibitor 1-like [Aedes albopictus]